MKIKLNVEKVIDDYDIVTESRVKGVIIVEDDDYDFEGNFTQEQLEKNSNKMYIPHIYFCVPVKNEYENPPSVQYIGAFLTEDKAQKAKEIFDLVYQAEDFINKNGLDKGNSKKFLWGLTEKIASLGGNNQVHLEGGLDKVSFLDEADVLQTVDKAVSKYTSISESSIEVIQDVIFAKDMKKLKKIKKKNS